MENNLHPKNCEKERFKVARFPNRTTRLIHQMWDKMVIVIVIKKNKKMMTTSETPQIDVEGCLVIKAPKKRKKEVIIEEERRR
jgi:hypothetical protein